MRISLIAGLWPVLIAACLTGLRASGQSEVANYRAVQPGQPLSRDTFAVFCPTNIPGRADVPQTGFSADWSYSGRDWERCPDSRKRRRFPIDPTRFQHVVLAHRFVPAVFSVTFERVEATEDSDPVTLAKILRYNREAHAKFRLLNETSQRIGGVDGSLAEYVELLHGTLMRVRHWIAHYNGVVYQIELDVPYEHPELMELGGSGGFPVLLHFLGATRNRSVLKDADIPRRYVSRYGYRIDLGAGDWIPEVYDPYIPAAENLMCTRNQGGIAVVPLSTLGQEVDRAALIDAMIWLGELPANKFTSKPRRAQEGNVEGIGFEVVFGDEEETIRMRGKALCSTTQGYLALAWINTNSPLSPDVLDQWLAQVSFTDTAAPWPPDTKALTGFREKDRHAMGFWGIGQYYLEHRKFDRSAAALRTALDCRFLEPILSSYTESELQGGHPEAIVSYLKNCGPIVLRQGWVAMELASAESRCGDVNSAAAHYTQCLASGGYTAGAFPPGDFEDYIRCLIKVDRRQWAAQRLRERIAVDPSPRWTKMLAGLNQAGSAASPSPPSPAVAAQAAPAPAPTPTGPPELRSIMWSSTKPSAQLDKSLAFEGDRVRGYKVTKISQDSVDLLSPEGASLKVVLSAHTAGN